MPPFVRAVKRPPGPAPRAAGPIISELDGHSHGLAFLGSAAAARTLLGRTSQES